MFSGGFWELNQVGKMSEVLGWEIVHQPLASWFQQLCLNGFGSPLELWPFMRVISGVLHKCMSSTHGGRGYVLGCVNDYEQGPDHVEFCLTLGRSKQHAQGHANAYCGPPQCILRVLGSWFISDISSLLPVSVSLIGNVVSAVTALWQWWKCAPVPSRMKPLVMGAHWALEMWWA